LAEEIGTTTLSGLAGDGDSNRFQHPLRRRTGTDAFDST
jgi:hypothetical protein